MSAAGSSRKRIPGVLFLYNRPTLPWAVVDADNVDENIAAFMRHSRLPIWGLNTDLGYRPALDRLDFDAVIAHYTVFVPGTFYPRNYLLDQRFLDFLERSEAYKVAFFQDEYHWCHLRFAFLRDFGFNCVYTLLEQPHADEVYKPNTDVTKVVPHIPSYVGKELTRAARRYRKRDSRRSIDIGYRGRSKMHAYFGRGGQEKIEIGDRFAERAKGSGLKVDISNRDEDRIFGRAWHRFMADCRATLGTESGVSCFDLEDEVRLEYEQLAADGHEPTLEEMERGALGRWDWKIPYRTVSPRNFEAAAFEVAQILYEGSYSGVLEPMRHYIPLRKDFSNYEEAIARFLDDDLRRELVQTARRELVDSGEYSYERFISSVDDTLEEAGVRAGPHSREVARVARDLPRSPLERWKRFRLTRLNRLYVERPHLWRLAMRIEAPYWRAAGLLRRVLPADKHRR